MKLRNKKTGDIGELSVWYRADNKEIKEFGVIKENEKFPTDYKSLAELTEEWEDYEEPKEYWYIEPNGVIARIDEWDFCTEADREIMKQIGNYFETKEEAEKAVEKLKAWKRLKDKGFEFEGINEVDGSIKTGLSKGVSLDACEDFYDDMLLLFGGEE